MARNERTKEVRFAFRAFTNYWFGLDSSEKDQFLTFASY